MNSVPARLPTLDLLPVGTLAAVVAMDRNRAIGRSGGLPWSEPEDMAHFRRVTSGHAVIIGSTTWTDIGRALPGRTLVVVTRRSFDVPEGVVLAPSPATAVSVALQFDDRPIVGGGSQIYEALLPHCGRVWATHIEMAVEGADAWFPAVPSDEWRAAATWSGESPNLTFEVLDRL